MRIARAGLAYQAWLGAPNRRCLKACASRALHRRSGSAHCADGLGLQRRWHRYLAPAATDDEATRRRSPKTRCPPRWLARSTPQRPYSSRPASPRADYPPPEPPRRDQGRSPHAAPPAMRHLVGSPVRTPMSASDYEHIVLGARMPGSSGILWRRIVDLNGCFAPFRYGRFDDLLGVCIISLGQCPRIFPISEGDVSGGTV